jgi:hypothetical protein
MELEKLNCKQLGAEQKTKEVTELAAMRNQREEGRGRI